MKVLSKKKIVALFMLVTAMLVAMVGNAFAVSTTSASIGKLSLTTAYKSGFKTATAKTTISTAASPATGFVAQATVKTTNENGTVKTVQKTDSASSVSASRTATSTHYFVKAKGVHEQIYFGSVILTENTSLSV
jgi:uncharacterized membrane protein YbhN (UPF0104 family)